MNQRLRLLCTCACALLLAACGGPKAPAVVSDAWVRLPAPGADRTAAYLTLENRSDAALLVEGVVSPRFARSELHSMSQDGGMMRMRQVQQIEVAAGDTVMLAPGGLHVMLFDPDAELVEGEAIPLAILANGQLLTELNVEVRRSAP